jgi:riboflavin kinase/FMN adenylyltransferase
VNFYRILQHKCNLPKSDGRVLTLGSFDGLHLGHQKVINKVIEISRQKSLTPSLLSFYPHPSVRLKRAVSIPKITSLYQRLNLLTSFGINDFFLLNFTNQVSKMGWEQFCQQILIDKLNVKHLIIGADARIGKGAQGNSVNIPEYFKSKNLDVSVCDLDMDSVGSKYSSRHIRDFITKGDLKQAKTMLGRDFQIHGAIIKGQQLGRKMGFPTANLYNVSMITPPNGVYAVQVQIVGQVGKLKGVMNIGVRPTVNSLNGLSEATKTVEVHILNYSSDIYGKKIVVDVFSKIRDEHKFDSIEQLKNQIEQDCIIARNMLGFVEG